MARRPTIRERMEAAAKQIEPQMRAAFLASVADITTNARLTELERALERGDIEAALRALNLQPEAYLPLAQVQAAAYQTGGQIGAASITGLRPPGGAGPLLIRFDARAPEAERWLAVNSGQKIERIVADQRAGIGAALVDGLAAGRNPKDTALDVVGRVNRATGLREGGIVGLNNDQMRFVARAREQLSSGEAALLKAYKLRTRRDRRFDPIINQAIAGDRKLTKSEVEKIVGRYADRLLKTRADNIARTETFAALSASKDEAYRQAIRSGVIEAGAVRKVWRSAGDTRVRDSHAALNGDSVGFDEIFPNGLAYPNDPSGDPAETINCRCIVEERIDFTRNLR